MIEDKSEDNKQHILVADDDPAILRLVKTIVEKEGYIVDSQEMEKKHINSSNQGTILRRLIFDIVMPYIQGTELVRYMQSEKQLMNIPVIMMTAEQNPRLSSDSFSAGQ